MHSIEPQLIQMSGVPGAGKSTIARALGARFDLIVLDHDLTKSGILATGLADKAAGCVLRTRQSRLWPVTSSRAAERC